MEDLKNFASALTQIAEERGIPKEKVIEIIEMAISAAYKKDYGKKGQIIKAKLDSETGKLKFWQLKQVLTEDMIYSEKELEELKESKVKEELGEKEKKVRFNPERHIILEEALKVNPEIKAGEEIQTELETREDYGRIAAQTAKQVILQRIREAERDIVFNEYKSKEGELVSGIVQRVEPRAIFLDIGKTLGILPREEQVPGEFYRPGQRLKVYILKVETGPKGPMVFLSRQYPKFISKLFELEVPEIANNSVEIKAIARESGSRSKVAVVSKSEGVDPIGAMVGQRGTRVSAVISELGGEKIDVIEWSEDASKFIANAMSPAKTLEVKILPKNRALVLVPEEQLSLAIGKEGQNVRLAAKLTGWKIDVRSPAKEGEEMEETGIKEKKEEGEEKEKKEDREEKGERTSAAVEEKKEKKPRLKKKRK